MASQCDIHHPPGPVVAEEEEEEDHPCWFSPFGCHDADELARNVFINVLKKWLTTLESISFISCEGIFMNHHPPLSCTLTIPLSWAQMRTSVCAHRLWHISVVNSPWKEHDEKLIPASIWLCERGNDWKLFDHLKIRLLLGILYFRVPFISVVIKFRL